MKYKPTGRQVDTVLHNRYTFLHRFVFNKGESSGKYIENSGFNACAFC